MTKIKICGFSEEISAGWAVQCGADAVGFVFYPHSARYVDPLTARQICDKLPPFVERVGLFVNADSTWIKEVVDQVGGLSLLQFHGDEPPELCLQAANLCQLGFIKAISADNLKEDYSSIEQAYAAAGAKAILVDTPSKQYGGTGQTFDWSVLPAIQDRSLPLILSGGLNADNVGEAIHSVEPYAVDVSSGVELVKGVKDKEKIDQFIQAVCRADKKYD